MQWQKDRSPEERQASTRGRYCLGCWAVHYTQGPKYINVQRIKAWSYIGSRSDICTSITRLVPKRPRPRPRYCTVQCCKYKALGENSQIQREKEGWGVQPGGRKMPSTPHPCPLRRGSDCARARAAPRARMRWMLHRVSRVLTTLALLPYLSGKRAIISSCLRSMSSDGASSGSLAADLENRAAS